MQPMISVLALMILLVAPSAVWAQATAQINAFAQPAPGTLGTHRNNSIEGPGFWTVDLARSRLVSAGAMRRHSAASSRRRATRGSCSSASNMVSNR